MPFRYTAGLSVVPPFRYFFGFWATRILRRNSKITNVMMLILCCLVLCCLVLSVLVWIGLLTRSECGACPIPVDSIGLEDIPVERGARAAHRRERRVELADPIVWVRDVQRRRGEERPGTRQDTTRHPSTDEFPLRETPYNLLLGFLAAETLL